MNNLEDIIISCLVSPAIFEFLKYFTIYVINKVKESSLPNTMDGYWFSYCEEQPYTAYELLKIKQQNSKLNFHLYQLTNDKRFYVYKGTGYIRGSKVSLSYEEVNSNVSSSTGNITLLKREISQHTPNYQGLYSEFHKDDVTCSSRPYTLNFLKVKVIDKILLTMLKSLYAKKYMKKECFINAYKNTMQ